MKSKRKTKYKRPNSSLVTMHRQLLDKYEQQSIAMAKVSANLHESEFAREKLQADYLKLGTANDAIIAELEVGQRDTNDELAKASINNATMDVIQYWKGRADSYSQLRVAFWKAWRGEFKPKPPLSDAP